MNTPALSNSRASPSPSLERVVVLGAALAPPAVGPGALLRHLLVAAGARQVPQGLLRLQPRRLAPHVEVLHLEHITRRRG